MGQILRKPSDAGSRNIADVIKDICSKFGCSDDYYIKLVLVGDPGVGKSCLVRRFAKNKYRRGYFHTNGLATEIKRVRLNGKRIKLEIVEVGDLESIPPADILSRSYYSGAHGIILVYDVANQESFNNVKQWLQEIDRYASENVNKLLVGNKCDVGDWKAVDYATGKEYADQLGMLFAETSARIGINVEEAFMILVAEIMKGVSWRQSRGN